MKMCVQNNDLLLEERERGKEVRERKKKSEYSRRTIHFTLLIGWPLFHHHSPLFSGDKRTTLGGKKEKVFTRFGNRQKGKERIEKEVRREEKKEERRVK